MGLFSKKREGKDVEQSENPQFDSSSKERASDMVTLIKHEQQRNNLLNPFVVSAPTVAQKSIAKQYGNKYVGAPGLQIASSIVVDVRSYNKSDLELDNDDIEDDDNDMNSGDSSADENVGSSFFDEIMKCLDDAENFDVDKSQKQKDDEPKMVVNPKQDVVVKKTKKTTSAGKRKIDIDIISGDFGGSDII